MFTDAGTITGVPLSFARQLEREQAALLKRLEELCKQWEETARKDARLKSGGLYLFTAKELRAIISDTHNP